MLCQLQRKIRIHNNEVVEYFCLLTVYINIHYSSFNSKDVYIYIYIYSGTCI